MSCPVSWYKQFPKERAARGNSHSLKGRYIKMNCHLRLLLTVFIPLLFLSACNQSIEKAVSKEIKHNNNSEIFGNPLVPLACLYSVKSLDNIGYIKDTDMGAAYRSEVYDNSILYMQKSLKQNLFKRNSDGVYYGMVRCTAVTNKCKAKLWGIAPMVLTLCNYALCNGPLGHCTFEKEYVFDIVDAKGSTVKSYKILGKKNNIMTLYGSNNYEGTEFCVFQNALKTFETLASNDAAWLNARLTPVAMDVYDKINGKITERDIILADWLNSGEYPTMEELNQAVTDAPNDYVGWGLRANYYLENRMYSSAMADFEKYSEINPACRIMTPIAQKAQILYNLNRKDEALDALQTAKALYPDMDNIYVLEGMIYSECGSVEMAYKSLEKALSVNPDNLSAIEGLDYLTNARKEIKAERKRREIDEATRKAMAMSMIAQSMQTVSNSINTANSWKNSSNNNVDGQSSERTSSSDAKSRVKTKDCSLCRGKGWIAGTSGMSMGGYTHYCKECGREVPSSHSHDDCPSCRGNGKVTRIF